MPNNIVFSYGDNGAELERLKSTLSGGKQTVSIGRARRPLLISLSIVGNQYEQSNDAN
jgi:hypothetical protein